MTNESPVPVKRLHPLPGLCWLWPLGGLFLLVLGAAILTAFLQRYDSPPDEKFPPNDPRWRLLFVLGGLGVITGVVYLGFWYRFAVRQSLNRGTWHTGTGLILGGAAWLFCAGWFMSGVIFLLVLAVWTQGLTRQHFDKS
jgi:hypothetical protein